MSPDEEAEIRLALDPRGESIRSLGVVALARALRTCYDAAVWERKEARLQVAKLLEERKLLEWAAEKASDLYDIGVIADEAEADEWDR